MGINISKIGRWAFGCAAQAAGRAASLVPGLDHEYHIEERLRGPWPVAPEGHPYLWLHGASLGECRMLLSLAKALKEDLPNCPPLLVTTQKVEVLPFLREKGKDLVESAIAPADIPSALTEFLKAVQPLGLILAENELWPGFLSTLSRISTKKNIALVSGRFRRALPQLDFSGMGYACMQTAPDLGRFAFATKGCVPCTVGSDWKLLSWVREGGVVGFPEKMDIDTVFLSFHREESDALLRMLKDSVDKGDAVVLMPRRLSELSHFRRALLDAGLPVVDYPAVRKGSVSLVTCYGLSHEILSVSRSAVVGGSFVRHLGIHDFWEPLRMGVSTCVGPYARGHEEAVSSLVGAHVLARINSPGDYLRRRYPSLTNVQSYLASEKKKVSDSYTLLLNFLKGLLP